MNRHNARDVLLQSLSQRVIPESLSPTITEILGAHLPEALPKPRWLSSMAQSFTTAAPLTRQEVTMDLCESLLARAPSRTRMARRVARLRRAYHHETIEQRAYARLLQLAQFAETAFAPTLTATDLTDDASLCFVAWMTARLGMRSQFTNGPQVGAFDTVAQMLLSLCDETANWAAIARVFPRADILARVSQADTLTLLDESTALLHEIAARLDDTATRTKINVRTMIVQSGNDSSTWNALAGAWNKARDYWLSSLDALGWLDLLDHYCPGKVLRLMAADVASWHQFTDGADSLHPDTKVWRLLPMPWTVLSGKEPCNRGRVAEACRACNVDPVTSGWTGPKTRSAVAPFTPTPELVYGVTVDHPALARMLRTAGVFSGKTVRPEKLVV